MARFSQLVSICFGFYHRRRMAILFPFHIGVSPDTFFAKFQVKINISFCLVLDLDSSLDQSCRCPGRDKRRNESDWAMLVFFGRAVSNNCVRRGKMLEGKPLWYFTVRRWTNEMKVFISSLILRFYVIYTLRMDANETDNRYLVNWLCFFTWTSDIKPKLWNHALSMLNSPLPNWTWLSKCF